MEGVWFAYPGAPERGWVLQDVSFEVAGGEPNNRLRWISSSIDDQVVPRAIRKPMLDGLCVEVSQSLADVFSSNASRNHFVIA